jgi:hypothetical protein
LSFDLGYFALFGLSRLECLLGDYHASLAVLAPIDLFSDHEYYHKVFACYLQLAYHAGVAYLMARRFGDAKRTLAHVVLKVIQTIRFDNDDETQSFIVKGEVEDMKQMSWRCGGYVALGNLCHFFSLTYLASPFTTTATNKLLVP